MLRHLIGIGLLSICLLNLQSCKVGPNFKVPSPPLTHKFTRTPLPAKTVSSKGPGGEGQYLVEGMDIPHEWWTLFQSPELNHLIVEGMMHNPSVDIAQAALHQAQDNWRAEVGALMPTITANFAAERERFNTGSFGITPQDNTFNLYNANVAVSYPLDVFGGIRRQVEAAGAQVDYQRYEVEATYLTLTANIVTSVINEASLREQIKTTEYLIKIQSNLLKLINLQYKLGGTSLADVLTQQTLVSQTMASLPPLQKNLALLQNSLSVLLGTLPSESQLPEFTLDKLHLPRTLPLGVPSTLVCQRPDVQASLALLHAASAQIGVATANLLPQFLLSGAYGSQANKIENLFDPTTLVWNLMAQATQTVFQGGTLIARRQAAIDAFKEAAAQYRLTVLQAFQNVADSLNAVTIDAQTLQADTIAEMAAKKNMRITEKQYQLGSVSFLILLNAEDQYQQTILARVQAEAARYSDTAALFQALGGGWWHPAPPALMLGIPPPDKTKPS